MPRFETIRGERYRVTKVGPFGEGKFYNRRIFYLEHVETGKPFMVSGRNIVANMKPVPCKR